jgi:polyisoprenyl-phosphate glycosyltransferase
MPRLFVICPCYNEEAALPGVVGRIAAAIAASDWVLVLVDDGSTDATWRVVSELAARSPRTVGVRLSRNFGHQAAVCAGLDWVMGEGAGVDDDTIAVMDSDGQHPPEELPRLIARRAAGPHHVQMIRRDELSGAGPIKRLTSRFFYHVFSWLSGIPLRAGSSDFRAFSGYFLRQYLRLHEKVRFNRGLFAWMGFRVVYLEYQAAARTAGRTSYSLIRMLRLALRGIVYFSSRPLVLTSALITVTGFIFCGGYLVIETVRILRGATYVAGWPTILFVVTLWGSLLSLTQLLTAIYIARIFDEAKGRPIYLIEQVTRPPSEPESS